jgi:hypothetical protein
MSAIYLVAGIVLGLLAYWFLQDTWPFRYHSRYVYDQRAPYRNWGPPTGPVRWPRLFGQISRFDKWNVCQG